ncbi:hypothetical protein JOD54_005890 [Actinokineospora baliensis]|uniref:hypothetical protein n=1 Tax=Actinokineospora baliensis TaxID=547056 RepID=UPI00195C8C2B|nr:hypothetical protein [Actinokineospora baliensis]MBM7775686.1 hypothetical protein [Actinokineospora baliensis]
MSIAPTGPEPITEPSGPAPTTTPPAWRAGLAAAIALALGAALAVVGSVLPLFSGPFAEIGLGPTKADGSPSTDPEDAGLSDNPLSHNLWSSLHPEYKRFALFEVLPPGMWLPVTVAAVLAAAGAVFALLGYLRARFAAVSAARITSAVALGLLTTMAYVVTQFASEVKADIDDRNLRMAGTDAVRVLPEVEPGPAGTVLAIACVVTLIGLVLAALPTTRRSALT